MAEKYNGFIFDKDEQGIVTITMDMDGPVNSMNAQFRAALKETADRLEEEPGLTGVVFASAKSTFFAGGDLIELSNVPEGMEEQQYRMIEDDVKAHFRRIEKLPVPVVAAINGAALGGGLEICLICNYRIALNRPEVQLGLPEVTLGLLPGGGGMVRTIHMLGLEKALPLALQGTRMAAAKACDLGLVDALVDEPVELIAAAKAYIQANPQSWAQPWDRIDHHIPGGDIANPEIQQLLMAASTRVLQETRGLLPAPQRIISVATEIVTVDFETAQHIETRGLTNLIMTPHAKNIITAMFFQMNAIKSGKYRPRDITKSKVARVGVVGAGRLGQAIAYISAVNGVEVVLQASSLAEAESARLASVANIDPALAKGLKTEADKTKLVELILPLSEGQPFIDCDLVIDTNAEAITLKTKAAAVLASPSDSTAINVVNSSTLPLAQLAEARGLSEEVIGINFLPLLGNTPVVEIICGQNTPEKTIAKVYDFVKQIRKTPIVVNDSPGFFIDRVLSSYLDEGARLLTEGTQPILIEEMAKAFGMTDGPLAYQDEVGQEFTRNLAAAEQALGLSAWVSDNSISKAVSERMVTDYSRGGRHLGGGFYDYPEQGEKQLWPQLGELFFTPQLSMAEQDIKDRLLFRLVIEALKCLQEGVLRSVGEGNIASLLAIGAPHWTGGFLQFVNTYGLEKFILRCDQLATLFGDRFKTPEIVLEKLKAGASFID
ncbi:enoyl-CoA hydratase-related protein [Halioxenophilus sp. WMMB6]|uniref:enoyl-CoA hydratase-related protein n=1 Tax=Halioxenophilus sp. WMMB6 TaxID=3073815 RepID=UPI00295F197D|nr:enoyl-CoA hydratase-related protein [Halioxenophilus sp. WMMB6]